MRQKHNIQSQTEANQQSLYFSEEDNYKKQQKNKTTRNNKNKNTSRLSTQASQASQAQTSKQAKSVLKVQQLAQKKQRKQQVIDDNTMIKLEPRDIRFIEEVFEKKHGKILTLEQMQSYKKKMVNNNPNQSNPYTELNYNTGEGNEWKDNMKKALSQEDLKKMKKQFLTIMKMVDKGQHSKYTLRDLAREFNLDESAFLQLRRQFSIDSDISIYINKFAPSAKSKVNESPNYIKNRLRKTYILDKIISKNPLLTRKELTQKIAGLLNNQLFFPESQVQKLLQQEGFKWQKLVKYPQSKNFIQNLERKKFFCQKVNYILTKTKYKVFFLGIMNFNTYMFRSWGWTKDQYVLEPWIDESFSLVALTEKSGIGTWKFQRQIYKQDIFQNTAQILFDILLPPQFQPKYLVVDFSLYKYKDVLRNSRKKFDLEIIWIPPFSDILNPLQFWFDEIKSSLSKSRKMLELSQQCNVATTKNQVLIKDIYEDLCHIFKVQYNENFQFTKYFEMTARFHEKALKLQRI